MLHNVQQQMALLACAYLMPFVRGWGIIVMSSSKPKIFRYYFLAVIHFPALS